MSLRIGLTGGIGSGKSTVSAWLSARGICIVDTDAIARQLTQPGGAALPELIGAFGSDLLDKSGALDRARMRQVVFSNPDARRILEKIIHPLVGQEAERQACQARPEHTVVFDVPLLTESAHWRDKVDKILVVDCLHTTQVARVHARSEWPTAQVWGVIAQQSPRTRRRQIADAVIYNEGLRLEQMHEALQKLWKAGFFTPALNARV
jgi:dephospho-CoA kinase